jgi:hypothetical protein
MKVLYIVHILYFSLISWSNLYNTFLGMLLGSVHFVYNIYQKLPDSSYEIFGTGLY